MYFSSYRLGLHGIILSSPHRKDLNYLLVGRMASTKSVLVIGGAGFVGDSIMVRLMSVGGFAVSCLDMAPPSPAAQEFCTHVITGRITDMKTVLRTFQLVQPEIVIHLASFGMSGADMLDSRCVEVNVIGTANIIRACIEENVKMLVYTSSYNVIFGGEEIYNGEERHMQYYPPEMAIDQYGPTKAMAERAVIAANGACCSNGHAVLRTCSIRPAAIYGEQEKRHFNRIVKHMDSGVFVFRIGSALVDWVYIDNLVRK